MIEEALIKLTNALYKVTGLFPVKEPLKFAIRKEALDVLFFSIASEKHHFSLVLSEKESLLEKSLTNIKLLKTYFSIAMEQHWVDNRNFEVLENGYTEIEQSLRNELFKTLSEKKEKIITAQIESQIEIKKSEEKELKKETQTELKSENKTSNEIEEKSENKKQETSSSTEIDYAKLTDIQLKVLELLQGKGQLKTTDISKHFPNVTTRTIRRELKGLRERNIINPIGIGRAIAYELNQVF
ncbi:MAG: DeoR family transcriptional regulator [Candidatus Paceibacterota bacterium]|jgi:hypothetical protein